jgi:hypothetical protein
MKMTLAGDRSMMLRLALLGMVAALGFTLPNRPDGSWYVSAETWTNSVMANWDTWKPREAAGQASLYTTTVHECEQCRLARALLVRTELRGPSGARTESARPVLEKTPSWTPRVDAGTRSISASETASTTTGSSPVPVEPIASCEDVEVGFLADLCRSEAEWVNDAGPPALNAARKQDSRSDASFAVSREGRADVERVVPDASRQCGADAPALNFASGVVATNAYGPELFDAIAAQWDQHDDVDSPTRAKQAAATAVLAGSAHSSAAAVPASAPEAPPIAGAPAVVESALRSDEASASGIPWPVFAPIGPLSPPAIEVAHEMTVPWPVFAPVEPAVEPTAAKSAGASRTPESSVIGPPEMFTAAACQPEIVSQEQGSSVWLGLSTESPPSPWTDLENPAAGPKAGSHDRSDRGGWSPDARWGQAVELTREAVCAWMKVLAGPAVVEITAR